MKVFYSETHRGHRPTVPDEPGGAAHPEIPERAERIAAYLRRRGFAIEGPREYEVDLLRAVHAPEYVTYLESAGRMGVAPSFGLETDTPITAGTFAAALAGSYCALTAADALLEGAPCAYALCRPPGHHAGRAHCAGFCYLNNAALAATRLARVAGHTRRVAVLDLDYHHGNGTQEIFYDSDAVLYVSLHAHPCYAYPYRWGFAEERGNGAGAGYNLNIPLQHGVEEAAYLGALAVALAAVREYAPDSLVVSLGTDTFIDDPLGTFRLEADSFGKIGGAVAELGLPTLIVQEGGYHLSSMGACVGRFCTAVCRGVASKPLPRSRDGTGALHEVHPKRKTPAGG